MNSFPTPLRNEIVFCTSLAVQNMCFHYQTMCKTESGGRIVKQYCTTGMLAGRYRDGHYPFANVKSAASAAVVMQRSGLP